MLRGRNQSATAPASSEHRDAVNSVGIVLGIPTDGRTDGRNALLQPAVWRDHLDPAYTYMHNSTTTTRREILMALNHPTHLARRHDDD